MGVKNLWDVLESCKKTVPLHHLQLPSISPKLCFFFLPSKRCWVNWRGSLFCVVSLVRNKRVCVDLSCWMVQLHSVSKSHACVKEKVYLRGLFHRLRALIALNCSLIFVSGFSHGLLFPSLKHRGCSIVSSVVRNTDGDWLNFKGKKNVFFNPYSSGQTMLSFLYFHIEEFGSQTLKLMWISSRFLVFFSIFINN